MKTDRYSLTLQQEKKIWENAFFVFDTSSLLNFYEYSETTIDDIFGSIFTKLKDRLWLPYNVNFEYSKNRHKPINQTIALYEDLNKLLKTINDNFNQIKNRTISQEKHPFIDNQICNEFEPLLDLFKQRIETEIKTKVEIVEKTRDEDGIYNRIKEHFSIGKPYKYSQIIEIIKEGEFRYKHSIPPGYKDESSKIGFQKFADLIIWKQIIENAKNENRPIIFVMDDNKEDWWVLDNKRKPIKPREELIEEALEYANVQFWMYSTSKFIETSKSLIASKIDEKSIKEVKNVVSMIRTRVAGISLSANRGDEERWRLERLGNVARFYKKNSEVTNIVHLHDHKGLLTVTWIDEPTIKEKHTIELAWESENELQENIEHKTEEKTGGNTRYSQ
jgi:hypothetical protein